MQLERRAQYGARPQFPDHGIADQPDAESAVALSQQRPGHVLRDRGSAADFPAEPKEDVHIARGHACSVPPGRPHLVTNAGDTSAVFLVLQASANTISYRLTRDDRGAPPECWHRARLADPAKAIAFSACRGLMSFDQRITVSLILPTRYAPTPGRQCRVLSIADQKADVAMPTRMNPSRKSIAGNEAANTRRPSIQRFQCWMISGGYGRRGRRAQTLSRACTASRWYPSTWFSSETETLHDSRLFFV